MASIPHLHVALPVEIELPDGARTAGSQRRSGVRSVFEQDQSARSFYMARQRADFAPAEISSHGTRTDPMLVEIHIPSEPPPAYRARARPGELDFPPSYEEPPTYDEVWDSVIQGQIRPYYDAVSISRQDHTIERAGQIVVDRAVHPVVSQDSESPSTTPSTQYAAPVTASRFYMRSNGWVFITFVISTILTALVVLVITRLPGI